MSDQSIHTQEQAEGWPLAASLRARSPRCPAPNRRDAERPGVSRPQWCATVLSTTHAQGHGWCAEPLGYRRDRWRGERQAAASPSPPDCIQAADARQEHRAATGIRLGLIRSSFIFPPPAQARRFPQDIGVLKPLLFASSSGSVTTTEPVVRWRTTWPGWHPLRRPCPV